MKLMIIISIFLVSLFAQDYTKKEFAAKAIDLGWNYETCAFGSSGIHINGEWAAMESATLRAVKNVIVNNCSKKSVSFKKYKNGSIKRTTVSSSGQFGYRIILQGKVKNRYVSAICANKPIICTK